MDYGVKSDVGKVRNINEDSYLAQDGEIQILAVADGMGGYKAGEIASAMAIETLRNYCGQTEDIRQLLSEVIVEADRTIYQAQSNNPDYQGMGTTITVAIVKGNLLYIGHVGDSRAYLCRNHNLLQITTDHSLVNELLKQEQITEEEALNHPQKHLLLQALGSGNKLDIEINCFSLERSDIILLCSDGLTNMVADDDITRVLEMEDLSLQQRADMLVGTANERGGLDNITLILMRPTVE